MAHEELKRIFPQEIYRLERGEEISVSPVPFGKLARFGEALGSVISKLMLSGMDMEKLEVKEMGRLFGSAFEEIVEIMALVLGKDREWFNEITLGDGLGLATIIVKQNFNEDAKKKLTDFLQRIPSSIDLIDLRTNPHCARTSPRCGGEISSSAASRRL